MASKIVFVCVTMAVFNTVYSQVIGRIGGCGYGGGCGGGCGCGCGYSSILPVAEQFINPCLPGVPSPSYLPSQVTYDQPTTIIQDSTVANNLANALQLLVVSNLLSSALPLDQPAPLAIPAAGLAPLEYLPASPFVNAPLSLSPFSPCGCGGCGCNSCGLGAFNTLY